MTRFTTNPPPVPLAAHQHRVMDKARVLMRCALADRLRPAARSSGSR